MLKEQTSRYHVLQTLYFLACRSFFIPRLLQWTLYLRPRYFQYCGLVPRNADISALRIASGEIPQGKSNVSCVQPNNLVRNTNSASTPVYVRFHRTNCLNLRYVECVKYAIVCVVCSTSTSSLGKHFFVAHFLCFGHQAYRHETTNKRLHTEIFLRLCSIFAFRREKRFYLVVPFLVRFGNGLCDVSWSSQPAAFGKAP